MRKNIIIASIVLTILVVGGGVFFFTRIQSNSKKALTLVKISPTPETETYLTWDDEVGFTLQYPENLIVNKHDEDQDNYAHLEFTSSSKKGNIIVWAKDTTAADVKAWVKTEKEFKNASPIDTTLGGQPAKKIMLSDPQKKIIIGTVYDGLLFTIEETSDDTSAWNNEFTKLSDSFTFKPTESNQSTGTTVSDDSESSNEVVDEEEILE